MQTLSRIGALVAVGTAAALVACNAPDSVQPVDHAAMHAAAASTKRADDAPNAAALATVVHAATSRFHSLMQAEKAGYTIGSPCVASPAGGMGFHYVNNTLVDPVFDPLNPEAVLYAPDANGNLKLVAVEYIVINVGQPAPTFAGQAFNVGGTPVPVAHWSLHVWVHQDNPAGMFAPFNPTVVCPTAG